MARTGLVIRNIEGIQPDDLRVALEGLEINADAPQEFNELLQLVNSDALNDKDKLNRALELIKLQTVRDYIYETVKQKTGNHVIYHLNSLDDNGSIHYENFKYIYDKLAMIPKDATFDMFYLGGGHGDPVLGSSNISSHHLRQLINLLSANTITCSVIILGSCFSTAYAGLYKSILVEDGVMLSHSLECGGDNHFHQALEWLNGQTREFFSEADIKSTIKVSREVRSAIRRILEGIVPNGARLTDEYNELLKYYKDKARGQAPDLAENRIYELSGDLFNADLDQLIIKMQCNKGPLNKEVIRNLLGEFPALERHIETIVRIKGEDTIFNALIASLQPTCTSLVIGAEESLFLFNFNKSNEMPPNSDQDYQINYLRVIDEVRKSGKFKAIHEQDSTYNAVSAKRQFNTLFVSATSEYTEQVEEQSRLIDEILNDFSTQVQNIGTNYPETKNVAVALALSLHTAKEDAFRITTKQSLKTFAQKATVLINAAIPLLERDLGWGDYLNNLAKKIANAITKAMASLFTLGSSEHLGFFGVKSSDAALNVKEMGTRLEANSRSTLINPTN